MAAYDGTVPADDVMQDETPNVPAARVVVEGPVEVRALPRVSAGSLLDSVDTTGKRVLPGDPRRASATVISLDQDIYLGQTHANVNALSGTPNGARWPKNVPLVIEHCDDVWISSVTSTTTLTVLVERWAR